MQLTHRLQIGASLWLGYRYARIGEQQEAPQMINGFPTSLYGTGTRAVDCSTFCAWMLMNASTQLQDREAYEALQIWDPASHSAILISASREASPAAQTLQREAAGIWCRHGKARQARAKGTAG